MSECSLPSLRWGIIGTGLISSWFVEDLVSDRPKKVANHVIQAVGGSSIQKAQAFSDEFLFGNNTSVYGSYQELYGDPNVDIVYIGTPHALHKRNCLEAMRAGKHVLCEKAFTLNSIEAEEVITEAKRQGVFLMEAMWTRFMPLVEKLRQLLHQQKVIGDVHRTSCDFSLAMDLSSLPPTSRLKNPALGAGSLLDIGIYSLTWVVLAMENDLGHELSHVLASQVNRDGIDIATTAILTYSHGKQGVATSSTSAMFPSPFCRIEGSKGFVTVDGPAPSMPQSFTVHVYNQDPVKYEFETPGRGYYWEADAVALDIAANKKENSVMPWAETLRIMSLMDEIRRQGGATFPLEENSENLLHKEGG
ncbi:D-xylose 1-dehydrogenase [Penicillium rolfsii]|nr:D-xylose 1-dehydrogenase [Penicillium rolfsii]